MHVFQSIVIAAIALKFGGKFSDQAEAELPDQTARLSKAPVGVDVLAGSLREPDSFPQMSEFIKACTQATNTGQSRLVRFVYFYAALKKLAV
jgi:hypothetical protein